MNLPCVGSFVWDLIKNALDKANWRVIVASRRVDALKSRMSVLRCGADGGSEEVDREAPKPSRKVWFRLSFNSSCTISKGGRGLDVDNSAESPQLTTTSRGV